MTNPLNDIRDKINQIDDGLLKLIEKRARLIDDVLSAKINQAGDKSPIIFDPARENEIINRMIASNTSPLPKKAIGAVFQTIINGCRNLQYKENTKATTPVISVQGAKGSHSENITHLYCQQKDIDNYTIDYAISSNNVLNAVNTKESQLGVVALNNAQGGLVEETIAALSSHQYRIVDSAVLLVEHSLLALSNNTDKKEIKHIYSHSQALRQCREYLKKEFPTCEIIAHSDTALAAKDLAEGKLKENSAVIAHKCCATDDHLTVLEENIQDLSDNETLFLIVKGAP